MPQSRIAAARREEILTAAATCFGRDGFHATSISKISAAAGMSAGHIYHFFPNKEAIVIGIVERQVLEWHRLLEQFDSDELNAQFVERMFEALEQRTRPEFIAIWHEVLAETAHNEKVSAQVRAIDAEIRLRMAELIRNIRAARGARTDTPVDIITEVALALYEGLSNRATLNPQLDKTLIKPVLVAATLAIVDA